MSKVNPIKLLCDKETYKRWLKNKFKPCVRYNKIFDSLTILLEDTTTVSEYLDNGRVILWNSDMTKIVGIKIIGLPEEVRKGIENSF